MINELWDEVHAKLELLREKMIRLHSNITMIIDKKLACLESPESTIPSEVVADEVDQLRDNFNVNLERPYTLLKEMDLQFSSVDELLAPLKLKNKSTSAHAPRLKERR